MKKSAITSDVQYRIEKIAPDGGYGWTIVAFGLPLSMVRELSFDKFKQLTHTHTLKRTSF